MAYTQLLSQEVAIAADGIHSASVAASTVTTGAVDLSKFAQVTFILDASTFGAAATVNFVVSGATTSGASYTSISSTSVTQLTSSSSSTYTMVTVTAEKVWALGLGYKWVKGALTIGTAASQACVIVLGSNTPYEPAANQKASTVGQILEVYR